MPKDEIFHAIFNWWIGESVGVSTVTPFLLIYVMPGLKRSVGRQTVRLPKRGSLAHPTLSVIGQVASLILTLYWVFGVRSARGAWNTQYWVQRQYCKRYGMRGKHEYKTG
jgi:integral membrane sensor domain MASE1